MHSDLSLESKGRSLSGREPRGRPPGVGNDRGHCSGTICRELKQNLLDTHSWTILTISFFFFPLGFKKTVFKKGGFVAGSLTNIQSIYTFTNMTIHGQNGKCTNDLYLSGSSAMYSMNTTVEI